MGLLIAGTGTFAAEIADWASAAGHPVDGLIELIDLERAGGTIHGLTVVGPVDVPAGSPVAIGVGGDRAATWTRLAELGLTAVSIVHPAAVVAADAELQNGVTVGPLAVIGAATRVGAQAIVSRGALVGHHVEIDAFATLNPGVNVGGNSRIGSGAFIGMGATIVNGVHVGTRAVIGAGAVVLRDVDAGERVQGIPARVVKDATP